MALSIGEAKCISQIQRKESVLKKKKMGLKANPERDKRASGR